MASTLTVLRRVADYVPVSVHQVNAAVPQWLSAVIDRLLAKNPAQRFSSGEECLAAIESMGAELRLPGEQKQIEKTFKIPNQKWVFAAAFVGCLIALALIAAVVMEAPQTHHFVLTNPGGGSAKEYRSLGAALKNAEADATVELRWNGELEMPPIDLPARPLVLRAAKQARPIWIHGDPSSDALVAHAPLTLKGIEFRFGSTNSGVSLQQTRSDFVESRSRASASGTR